MKTVAVLAVHGVGDQRPFETARRIADLLQALDRDGGAPYTPFGERAVRVSVRALDAGAPAAAGDGQAQDMRGPFHSWVTHARDEVPRASSAGTDRDASHAFMRGQLNGFAGEKPEDTYETVRLEGTRGAGGDTDERHVHVYELYWADLSRLKAGLLSIFTELYQLLFHLSSLGTHVVDAEALHHRAASWSVFRHTQSSAAMTLTVAIPILNLLMLGVTAVAVGLIEIGGLTPAWHITIGAAAVAGAGAIAAGCLLWKRDTGRTIWIAPVIAWLASVWIAAYAAQHRCGMGAGMRGACEPAAAASRIVENIALVAIAGALVGLVIAAYDRRRPGAGAWALSAAAVLVPLGWISAIWRRPYLSTDPLVFVWARTFEVLFAAMATSWIALFVLTIAATIAGGIAVRGVADSGERDLAARSRWTAQLTLTLPTFAFIVVTLTGWSLLAMLLKPLLQPIAYVPLLRGLVEAPTLADLAASLLGNPATVALPLVLVAGAAASLPAVWGLAPVLWTELRPPSPARAADASYTADLGRWLTQAFGALKLSGVIVFLAMTFALPLGALVALLQSLHYLPDNIWGAALPDIQTIGIFSGAAFAWLFAIRGRLRKLALGFRPGLDILLDVDNWMRELPAAQNPRARICGRYASLLRHIANQRYDRLVIIAHSQGTVITADLLRFLHEDQSAERGLLERLRETPTVLFTMGCPLRDLYSRRFPRLYRWAADPNPASLGVGEWENWFRSGDYVGRSLWAPSVDDGSRRDHCIGAGAHTHYWDWTAPTIAAELDRLIRWP